MKKRITTGIIFIALLCGIGSVNAQKKVTFGVRGGVNVSNVSGRGFEGTTMPRIGYNAGITVDFAATRNFYILSGVEFTTKGFETKASEAFLGTEVEAMYIQVPLHAGYAVHVNNNTKVIFHVGPYAAYGVAGDSKIKGSNIEQKTFSDDGLKKFDFGVGGGVDLDYKHFTIGLGYEHGLLNTAQNKGTSVYNSVAQLKVGIKF